MYVRIFRILIVFQKIELNFFFHFLLFVNNEIVFSTIYFIIVKYYLPCIPRVEKVLIGPYFPKIHSLVNFIQHTSCGKGFNWSLFP